MRYVYTTDEHFTSKQPKNRLDNYLESMLKKLGEVVEFVNENNVDIWLSGGDFFDTNVEKTPLLNKIMRVLSGLKRKTPILIIPGNHLIKGNAEKSVDGSGLATLEEAGFVQIKDDPYIHEDADTGKRLMMWHEMLIKDPVPWHHITFEDASKDLKGKADIVFCSHFHAYQGTYKAKNGVIFISPGAFARGMGNEINLKRPPRFFELVLKPNKPMKGKYHTLAKDNPYPFKDRVIKESLERKSEELVDYIRENLSTFGDSQISFPTVLDMLLKAGKVRPKIVEYLTQLYDENAH